MKVTVIPMVNGTPGTVTKGLVQRLEDIDIRGHLKYSIVKIGQNTKRSPGDLRRLDVRQTPVEKQENPLM